MKIMFYFFSVSDEIFSRDENNRNNLGKNRNHLHFSVAAQTFQLLSTTISESSPYLVANFCHSIKLIFLFGTSGNRKSESLEVMFFKPAVKCKQMSIKE